MLLPDIGMQTVFQFQMTMELHIFCRSCSKSICCTCTVLAHKPHDYADIKLEAQLQKQDLTQMSTALVEKEKEFAKICQDLLSLQDRSQHHKKELVEQIKASVKEALRKVEEKGEALLEELEGLYTVKEVEIKGRIVQTENVLRRIEASRGLVDNMITYAAWKEVMEMQDFVKSALRQLQSEQPLNMDSEETTVRFIQTTQEPSELLGSLVVSNCKRASAEQKEKKKTHSTEKKNGIHDGMRRTVPNELKLIFRPYCSNVSECVTGPYFSTNRGTHSC
ncbi:Protein PML [Acipenser ruthenus]|uniref:Protein PML n=1 Tax=Acipenser ruthenus TaxID=7906 RepID=A0A444V657_ACIRT|nr:Protein PML [Acipenser ruthenus]